MLRTLGLKDRLTAVALGLHLLLHGVLDVLRRQDVLQLYAVDLDAPRVSGLVQNGTHFGVDHITGGQGLIQFQIADDVTQGGSRQGLHGRHGLLHAVGVQLGVGDLEIHDGVDLHGDVILGDNGLRRIVQNLLLQADPAGNAVNEGNLEVHTHAPHAVERAQTLNDVSPGLLDNRNVGNDDNERDHDDC